MSEALLAELDTREALSRELDPDPAAFAVWMRDATVFAESFLRELRARPVRGSFAVGESLRREMPAGPRDFREVLHELERDVLTAGLNAASPRYLPFVSPGGLPAAAVADFLAAITNRYSGLYAACPGAVEVENAAVRWLLGVVGYPESAWGTLLSGGTLSAVAALVVARDTRPAARWEKGVVYRTSEGHHSLLKSLRVVGLGHAAVREIAVDAGYRMIPEALEEQIRRDRALGLEPWILLASAGTTNTGAVDPLRDLSAIARRESLWLHVDGAYGGLFCLTAAGRDRLAGIEQADSLVLDPHKSMFLPYGCGAVLVREGERLRQAFSYHPDYLADVTAGAERSPSDYSPEGTRHFRGLRIWLALQLHGSSRFEAALGEKLLLARYVFDRLRVLRRVTMGPPPQLSCVTFRLEDDARTRTLAAAIEAEASFACSSTQLGGRLFLRLCILNFRVHRAELDTIVDDVARLSDDR